jgi:hypothetical protein
MFIWKNVHNMESDDEIYMGDNDLDGNQKDIFQILMVQMQYYIPPTRKSP